MFFKMNSRFLTLPFRGKNTSSGKIFPRIFRDKGNYKSLNVKLCSFSSSSKNDWKPRALESQSFKGKGEAFSDRSQFSKAKTIVIKLGSAVITRSKGPGLALSRLSSLVEQVADLQNKKCRCILISSGAVAFGKTKLQTLQESWNDEDESIGIFGEFSQESNAAVGQSSLMTLYETLFKNYGLTVAQILLTKGDFDNSKTREKLFHTIRNLIHCNIIPIINTNDAVNPHYNTPRIYENESILPISDNDALAARIAVEISADLTLLLSNVDGIYRKAPESQNYKDSSNTQLLSYFSSRNVKDIVFGDKSKSGSGGMESKMRAGLWALSNGCSVVICNGMKEKVISRIVSGEKIGTFFTEAFSDESSIGLIAQNARTGSQQLLRLSSEERSDIIIRIAKSLTTRMDELLRVNEIDMRAFSSKSNFSSSLASRLQLTKDKIYILSKGLLQIAKKDVFELGKVLQIKNLSNSLILEQKTVPLGVLLVIVESRPDALPQIAALSIASSNGLLIKGGKEAINTNTLLIHLIQEALDVYKSSESVTYISSKETVRALLQSTPPSIDVVIPRGSSNLVSFVSQMSQGIPVLGHAEGICHVYVDKEISELKEVLAIILDSKTNAPSACNSMETLLIHEDHLMSSSFNSICEALKNSGVELFAGPNLTRKMICSLPPAENLSKEYGDLAATIEIVSSLPEAISHIQVHGSSHTDVILTSNEETARIFVDSVDSACVFVNCSSRMSDGYRMGLGAEIGISTSRFHARGPVGVQGLLTTKWILQGHGDTVSDYSSGRRHFFHENESP